YSGPEFPSPLDNVFVTTPPGLCSFGDPSCDPFIPKSSPPGVANCVGSGYRGDSGHSWGLANKLTYKGTCDVYQDYLDSSNFTVISKAVEAAGDISGDVNWVGDPAADPYLATLAKI